MIKQSLLQQLCSIPVRKQCWGSYRTCNQKHNRTLGLIKRKQILQVYLAVSLLSFNRLTNNTEKLLINQRCENPFILPQTSNFWKGAFLKTIKIEEISIQIYSSGMYVHQNSSYMQKHNLKIASLPLFKKKDCQKQTNTTYKNTIELQHE